ncbi:hypothetical protein A1O3_04490 [Capronia epimyces CBS 606.96]|uniref:RPA43 OB domain-containing protein n=1 Tax=Capronia epimyces CBS 606.96 TaxID=1182542 RepID=W9YCY8_9EURO|nr:uncharacterized protein A1O3_04490 [Capronia epimyces CBS 606.96]EXJ87530.1 hypothetical protein A1O3_04490 [Capronia epimyces CBS 606.96]
MSIQTDGTHVSASKKVESLTTPKKRKHGAEEKESSKKKKKLRTEPPPTDTESAAAVAAPAQALAAESKKKKKKGKDKDKEKVSRHKNGKHDLEKVPDQRSAKSSEPEDIEVADAPSPETEPTAAVQPATSSPAVNGEDGAVMESEMVADLLDSADPTSFHSTRLSLHLAIPAIGLEAGSPSLLATHLAPLLLTYSPPAQGIVLGFSDPVLSTNPDTGINLPLVPPSNGDVMPRAEVLAKTADEFGVCWVWLTATFLVFRPERGDELYGWTNVTSEGFVGLVSYNYFQTAVAKNRIPQDWIWNGPSREDTSKTKKKSKKGRLRDEDDSPSQTPEDEIAAQNGDWDAGPAASSQVQIDEVGFFVDAHGSKVLPTQKFRVVDTEVVPSHDRHKWSLQIEGTLLDEAAERRVADDERAKFELAQQRSRSQTPGDRGGDTGLLMSGALARSREGSVASRLSGPTPSQRHRVAY